LADTISERWAIVKEFPNYSVSDQGRVKRNSTNKILRHKQNAPSKSHSASYSVCFREKGAKRIWQTVHKLVATAFVPNPNNYFYATHIDKTKGNNASNLRWQLTAQDYQFDSLDATITRKQVEEVRSLYLSGMKVTEIYARTGRTSSTVYGWIKGEGLAKILGLEPIPVERLNNDTDRKSVV
jgi:hypothetical protein